LLRGGAHKFKTLWRLTHPGGPRDQKHWINGLQDRHRERWRRRHTRHCGFDRRWRESSRRGPSQRRAGKGEIAERAQRGATVQRIPRQGTRLTREIRLRGAYRS